MIAPKTIYPKGQVTTFPVHKITYINNPSF